MVHPLTAQLIRKLHYQGKVDDDKLKEILERYKNASAESLVSMLVEDGIVDEGWIEESRRALRLRSRRQKGPDEAFTVDRSFGYIALNRKWISCGQMEEAMLEQQRLHRLKLFFRIGEVLLRFKHLSTTQVREILNQQGHAVADCEKCNSIVKLLAGVQLEGKFCPFCQGELSPAPFLEVVKADG